MGGIVCFAVFMIGMLLLVGFAILIGWKVFEKAGRPGWECVVPIYSHWVLVVEICKKEPLWFFLAFVPIGNIIASWVITQELAKKFGKTEGFGVGLFFLSPVFMAILAFDDSRYRAGGRKRYADDYDDEDDDYDRPRKKKRRDDYDDDEDDDRPRKKKRDDNW